MRGGTWVDPEASSLPLPLGRRQGRAGQETLDSFVPQKGTAGEDRGGGGVIRTDTATISTAPSLQRPIHTLGVYTPQH